MINDLPFCKCGCEKKVAKKTNVFIRGHNINNKLIDITGEICKDFKAKCRATKVDLDKTKIKNHNNTYWKVECIHCGFEKVVGRANFAKSCFAWCGCIKDDKRRKKKLTKYKHEIGKKYNKLLVTDVVCNMVLNRGWVTQFECKCDCGNVRVYTMAKVKSDGVKSCGCLKYKVNIGDIFSSLKIIKNEKSTNSGHRRWLCECDCGGYRVVTTNGLKNNIIKACRECCNKEQKDKRVKLASERIIGKKFHNLVVMKVDSQKGRKLYYLCKCDCGETRIAPRDKLVGGRIRSCGCLGKLRNGNKKENQSGYVLVYLPDYKSPRIRDGRILEHVYIMEKSLGRSLKDYENIHHKNGIRNDNRIENLELWSKKHPPGQRVSDKTQWAIEWLTEYYPEMLSKSVSTKELLLKQTELFE